MNGLSPAIRNTILALFWAVLAVFLFTVLTMFFDNLPDEFLGGIVPEPLLFLMGLLVVLAGALFIVTLWASVDAALKRLLLLTSGSVIAAVFGVVLHNFFYALAELAANWRILQAVLSGLQVAFFLAALFLFPLTYFAGAIGVIIVLIRSRRSPGDSSPDQLNAV